MLISSQSISNSLNLTQTIYTQLKKDIYSLKLVPGEKLSEARLAAQYDCSRIPVREALQQLRLEGCIDSRPQIGSFISYIDYEKLEQLRYVRECLETQVMAGALRKGAFDHAIDELQDMISQQRDACKTCRFEFIHQLDNAFHNRFLELSHKEFVSDYMGINDVHYQRACLLALKYDVNPHLLTEQHQMILDAVITKDEQALIDAIHIHLDNLYNVIHMAPEAVKKYLTTDISQHWQRL